MKVIRTIRPNQNGAQRFAREWGEQLIAVRYRESPDQSKLFTTIEVIVDERERSPKTLCQKAYLSYKRQRIVAIKLQQYELQLQRRVMRKGGQFSKQLDLWLLRYEHCIALGLRNRIIDGEAERCDDVDMSFRGCDEPRPVYRYY